MARWTWNEDLGQYTSGNLILSSGDIQDVVVNDWIDDNIFVVLQITQLMANGEMTIQEWQDRMVAEIRNAYAEQAILAAGGRAQMTQQFWGAVGGLLRVQYRFLENFAQEIRAGHLSAGQIGARITMYINSARSAFWRIRDFIEKIKGNDQERWIPVGDDKTCGPCAEAGEAGWQPIGTFAQPGSGTVRREPGTTQCEGLTNCRCTKEYRKS
jgi:hypothetical protein